jgi:hypothetical protein
MPGESIRRKEKKQLTYINNFPRASREGAGVGGWHKKIWVLGFLSKRLPNQYEIYPISSSSYILRT